MRSWEKILTGEDDFVTFPSDVFGDRIDFALANLPPVCPKSKEIKTPYIQKTFEVKNPEFSVPLALYYYTDKNKAYLEFHNLIDRPVEIRSLGVNQDKGKTDLPFSKITIFPNLPPQERTVLEVDPIAHHLKNFNYFVKTSYSKRDPILIKSRFYVKI